MTQHQSPFSVLFWPSRGLALLIGLLLLVTACDSNGGGGPETVTLEGQIVNATDRGVRNAQMQFRRDGTAAATTTTNDDGTYRVRVPAGEYDVRVSAPGYNELSYAITAESDRTVDPRQLLGNANVSGTILDAQTGNPIDSAEVAFTFVETLAATGGAQTRSSHVDTSRARADLITTTDPTGQYGILQAPTGAFVCVIRIPGYVTEVIDVTFQDGPNEFAPTTTTEALAEGQLRIVLEWGQSPSDLDSHLTGPDGSGGRFHLYYANQAPATANANLDRDDTSSFGPETVTVEATRSGTYRYSVHNYSDDSENGALGIEQSPAQVKVYDDTGLIRTYRPPAATATAGNTWRVFEFDGSTRAIDDNGGDTLGYYQASSSGDVQTFRTPATGGKPRMSREAFDQSGSQL